MLKNPIKFIRKRFKKIWKEKKMTILNRCENLRLKNVIWNSEKRTLNIQQWWWSIHEVYIYIYKKSHTQEIFFSSPYMSCVIVQK